MTALPCPACSTQLNLVKTPYGIGWVCPTCHSRAANLSILRRAVRQPFMREVWRQASNDEALSLDTQPVRPCPSCRRAMRSIVAEGERNTPVQLSVCPKCQMIWLEAHEMDALPHAPRTEPQLNPQARELLARAEVEARYQHEDTYNRPPAETWQQVLGLLGFPIEENAPSPLYRPWVTWTLAATMTGVMLICLLTHQLPSTIDSWGLHSDHLMRHGGLTWLTSFFLHGNLLHLLGNLYFLLIFGDNVEDLLGRARFVLFLVCAEFAANLLHLAFHRSSGSLLIGSSGSISAIIVFYALALPHVRLVFCLWPWLRGWSNSFEGGWLRLSAGVALIAWVLLQLGGAMEQLFGLSNISAMAHLGGGSVGALAWWFWRQKLNPILE